MRSVLTALFASLPALGLAAIGETWVARHPAPTGNDLQAVVRTSTSYVAVGANGTVVRSLDGVSWTTQSTGTTRDLYGIASTGSRLVACGEAGLILTSTDDGLTWASVLSPQASTWRAATWTGSRIILVGEGGAAATSPDGATGWRARFAGTHRDFHAIASASGLSVAIGANGVAFQTTDGTAWTPVATGTTRTLRSVVHNGSLWLAVGYAGMILTSPDGGSWTQQISGAPSVANLFGVSWTGSLFIAGGTAGTLVSSPDGINWTARTSGTTSDLFTCGSNASQLLAMGERGTILTSADAAATWTAQGSGPRADLNAAILGSAAKIAVGDTASLLTTTDLTTWNAASTTLTTKLHGVAESAGTTVAVGENGATLRSTDRVNWTVVSAPAPRDLFDVHGTGTLFVAVGESGTVITSNDGSAWTSRSSGTVQHLRSVTSAGSLFMAVGDNGTILESANATTWTARSSGTTSRLTGIAIANFGVTSTYVAVGTDGMILTSTNRITWTRQTGPSAPAGAAQVQFEDVAWNGVEFIAVGSIGDLTDPGAYLASSYDGITWVRRSVSASGTLVAVATNSTDAIVVGAGGVILVNLPAPLPTLSFELADQSVPETSGPVPVRVVLSSPSSAKISFNFPRNAASTATLGATADYTISTSPLSILPGATSAVINVTILNDKVDEPDSGETLILDLTLASGSTGALLGGQRQHTLTILDNDTRPFANSLPESRIVPVGAPIQLLSSIGGDPTLLYQWYQNARPITNARATNYLVQTASLAHAGAYHLTSTNASGTFTMNPAAEIYVVDVTAKTYALVQKTTATFIASAAGKAPITYQWFKDGNPVTDDTSIAKRISGAGKNILSIKLLSPADDGVYHCTVTTSIGNRDSGTHTLSVIIPPVVNTPVLGPYVVSETVNVQLTAANGPTRWSVTGLPIGVTYNAITGVISGKALYASPTVPVLKPSSVSIVASNAAGPSPVVTVPLTITALPTGTVGSYIGLIDRHPSLTLNNNLGGRFTLTVAPTGGSTASLAHGALAHSLVKALDTTSTANPMFVGTIKRTSQPDLIINAELNPGLGELVGTLSDTSGSVNFRARRALAAPFTAWTGYHTAALKLTNTADVGVATIPQGHGYTYYTIGTTGVASGVMRLADGTQFSFALPMRENKALVLYQPLYLNTGSVLGLIDHTAGTPVIVSSTDMSWFKHTQTTGRSYKTTFGPTAVSVVGSRYTAPAVGTRVVGAADTADNVPNVALTFAEGGAPDPATRLNVTFRLTAPAVRDLQTPAVNPGKVTNAITAANGLFSGSFTLTDTDTTVTPNKPLPRLTYYYGILARDTDGAQRGFGHFNLAAMPSNAVPPTTTIATSPIVSGRVEIVPEP